MRYWTNITKQQATDQDYPLDHDGVFFLDYTSEADSRCFTDPFNDPKVEVFPLSPETDEARHFDEHLPGEKWFRGFVSF